MARVDHLAAHHEHIGTADAGFGPQAYCSCGWRTSPKESAWQAEATWHAHMFARTAAEGPALLATA